MNHWDALDNAGTGTFDPAATTWKDLKGNLDFALTDKAQWGGGFLEMAGFAEGHYGEFIRAIFGQGPFYEQTHSRCFSDIEYCIPQMEGILVGCVAQRLPNQKLRWDSKKQAFDVAAANAFVKPYIRKGFEF